METTLSQWYESSSALQNMDQKSYLSCGRSSWPWALRWTRFPNLLPPLSGEALWMASKELKSKQQKLDWLQVAKELLQHPDSEIAVLLSKEIAATEHAAENSHS